MKTVKQTQFAQIKMNKLLRNVCVFQEKRATFIGWFACSLSTKLQRLIYLI